MTAASSPAWADPTDQDNALALKLFDEGRALLAAGKVADACPKLEESWRLNPLPGTLLNLAVCHEQEGRTASAVAEFRQARALAERDRRDDRLSLADQHLHAIEGKVSTLVIVVGPDADRPDLSISRDGTAVGRTVWGSRIPMDPGDHVVEASAPNKKAWKAIVKVAPDGDVQTVTLKPLEDAEPVPAPPLPSSPRCRRERPSGWCRWLPASSDLEWGDTSALWRSKSTETPGRRARRPRALPRATRSPARRGRPPTCPPWRLLPALLRWVSARSSGSGIRVDGATSLP
jgi:hypothetical protein